MYKFVFTLMTNLIKINKLVNIFALIQNFNYVKIIFLNFAL
jgi:hypothetical protein